MRDNKEATKILSFLLYREQISSNRRPCIPAGAEAYRIYRDVIESCINTRVRLASWLSLMLCRGTMASSLALLRLTCCARQQTCTST